MTRTTRVLAPNPSIMTGSGTNTYLVGGDGRLACIDPGPDDAGHLEAILAAARELQGEIEVILLTHSHPDHRPLAAGLSARTGATVRCHDPSAGDESASSIADGEGVAVDGVTLVAVHTPGHTGDHLCFFDPDARALYTGDHILNGTTTVIHPVEGDMADYMASLRRVRELNPAIIFPGHGDPVDAAVALIDEYIAHREERERQVLGLARERGTFRPEDLVPVLYAGYPPAVHGLAAWSVQAHLDKLVRDGMVERLGPEDYRAR